MIVMFAVPCRFALVAVALAAFCTDVSAQLQIAKLTAADGSSEDEFGRGVSLSGDRLLIGSRNEDQLGSDAGAAYVFHRDGTSWVQQAKLLASDGASGDRFGVAVALQGDLALVGASRDDDDGFSSGSAYVFRWNGSSWVQEAKLTASDGDAGDFFGDAVSLSGDRALVGAPRNDDDGADSGSAYVFEWNGSTWTQQAKLLASDADGSDWFGFSVAL
jgi:hypothetical protein